MTSSQPQLFPDGPPLPEMREAVLSRDDVLTLVADLQVHTHVTHTLSKAAPRQQTPLHDVPLEEAVERLFDRTVSAIQIHYTFDGHEWTDTLLNAPTGLRMVRCRHAVTRPAANRAASP